MVKRVAAPGHSTDDLRGLAWQYVIATLQLKDSNPSGYQSRVFGMSSLSYWAIQQHLGYNLYELVSCPFLCLNSHKIARKVC